MSLKAWKPASPFSLKIKLRAQCSHEDSARRPLVLNIVALTSASRLLERKGQCNYESQILDERRENLALMKRSFEISSQGE